MNAMRAIFSGDESALSGPEHDPVRVFDYAQGFDRPDYIENSFGLVNDLASVDGPDADTIDDAMFYGAGNGNDHFVIEQHVGAGLELAAKVRKYKAGDYSGSQAIIGNDGTATYTVASGPSPEAANRADWSFDWSVVTGLDGSTSTLAGSNLKLWIDTDKSVGTNYVDFLAGGAIVGAGHNLDANVGGDSFNIGFGGNTDFGVGHYDFILAAYADAAHSSVTVHGTGIGAYPRRRHHRTHPH